MKTMQEVQALIRNLREIYTDVRLLDEATVERIQEGKRTDPCGEDLCYACRHKEHMSRHCAAKQALRTRTEQCRLEFFDPDIAQVIARYYEVDGKPYVLEMIKRTHGTSVLDMEDSEHFISSIPGYATKLYRDALTGVYNRRYYEETVSSLIGPAGVAVMDLDDFKIYNDTYGHHAGDLVLETVARVIRNCIRQTDTLIRFGGDEFLLLLPGIPAEKLPEKLEQIRSSVHEAQVPGYTHLRPSVSIGGVLQTLADPIEAVVRRADLLMYQAKNRKNAVVVADPQAEPEDPEQLPQQKQQILIVDDSAMNRAILSEILQQDYRILEAANGEEALERLNQYSGDIALVLLDLIMPGMDGFAVLEHIRGESCETPVIFLTALGAVADKVKGLRGGAEDYIVKPFEPVELLARIEVVLRRAGKSEMHLRYGDIQVDIEKHTALKNGVPVALTPKEFDVLVFFMRNPDVAITREQLLSNIWGFDFTGESRSVDIHVQQVRRKMGLQGKLITIPKLGYRLERR